MRNVEAYVESQIKAFAGQYLLRLRIHRVRGDVPVAVGTRSDELPVLIPTEYPFLLVAIGFASNRVGEGRLSGLKLRTQQVIFIDEDCRLQAFGGPNCEAGPMPWGPSIIHHTDKFIAEIIRVTGIDPAESFPGPTIPSLIDLVFIGFDCLPLRANERAEANQV